LCHLTTAASAYYLRRYGADTIQSICVHYAQKRRAAKRLKAALAGQPRVEAFTGVGAFQGRES